MSEGVVLVRSLRALLAVTALVVAVLLGARGANAAPLPDPAPPPVLPVNISWE